MSKMPDDVHVAMLQMVSYLWHDEENHFDNNPSPDHIFVSIRKVARYLDNLPASSTSYSIQQHSIAEGV